MNRVEKFVKKVIRERLPYSLPSIKYIVKLNQNENPYDLPDSIKDQILEKVRSISWNRYPDLTYSALREKNGRWLKVDKDRIILGNGSNEVLFFIMFCMISKGDMVLTVAPTFSMIDNFLRILEAENVVVYLKRDDFSFPVEILVKKAKSNYKLIVLCSPNNPTGTKIEKAELKEIIENAQGYVIVDEAYIDFTDQDLKEYVYKYDNLILVRTFSKAFSFAGGRFGYGILPVDLAIEVRKAMFPYNLSSITEAIVSSFINNEKFIKESVKKIVEQREILFNGLRKFDNIKAYKSDANFILIKTYFDYRILYKGLMEKGILVRDVSYYPLLENHLRITVGKPEENELLLNAMDEILSRV